MQTLKELLNGKAERYAKKPAFLRARRNYTFREVNESTARTTHSCHSACEKATESAFWRTTARNTSKSLGLPNSHIAECREMIGGGP
jgi:non-ribosomal peptide synthetase component E (peptide arylation enzyme)